MAEDEPKDQKAVAVQAAAIPTNIPLGPTTSLDLSWLPENERKALLTEYFRGALDISKKAQDLHVDVGALRSTLQTLAETARTVADDGNSVTMTHTATSTVGHTEIIVGNTDRAHRGKLSRSQTGADEWTPYYIIAAIIAVVIVIGLLAK